MEIELTFPMPPNTTDIEAEEVYEVARALHELYLWDRDGKYQIARGVILGLDMIRDPLGARA